MIRDLQKNIKLKPKFKINIIWLENELGIAVDQIQSGEQIPLTKYFFGRRLMHGTKLNVNWKLNLGFQMKKRRNY